MFLTSALVAGGVLYVGKRAYDIIQRPQKNLVSQLHAGAIPTSNGYSIIPNLSHTESEVDAHGALERYIDHNLAVSAVAMGLATAGALFYPPLSLVSIPIILYTCIDVFQNVHRALFKERRIRAVYLDAIAIIGALAIGAIFASALASVIYFLGQKLLLKTEDRARGNLLEIFGQRPRFVWRLVDGVEIETPFEEIGVGDVVVVNAGGIVPVDGHIVEGMASIDQRLLTGEAQPAEKAPGDRVFAATTVLAGRICVQVDKAGADTVTAQIAEILNQTARYESSIETTAQTVADHSVIPTLAVSGLTWPILGPLAAITVVYSNYTDTLRITAPLGMLNFLSVSSQRGLLIKDGRALELLNKVDTVIFDKTGTLTLEQPHVAAIYPLAEFSDAELLTLAAAAEFRQTHPIARAIRQAAQERELSLPTIDGAEYEVGYGITVTVNGKVIRVGSHRFMTMEGIAIPSTIYTKQEDAHTQGYSFVYVAVNDCLGGAIELHPTIRPEAHAVVAQLKQRKLSMVILSGDHEEPTRKLARELGIERYFAEVLPEEKARLVEQLQQDGKAVCFVGDGINDSIALKKANVSISLSGASTIATDTAQIILMDGTLNQLDAAFAVAERFKHNLQSSLFTALAPGFLCIAGVFFFHFRILSAVMLYNASLTAGVGNAMLPRFREGLRNNQQQ